MEFLARVDYQRALVEQTSARLLLLLQASPDTADLVPAKLFEYLRAGRPVLAVVGPGATADLLREIGGGWVADPRSAKALSEALVTAYQAWQSATLDAVAVDPRALKRFSRAQLAADLAALFDPLVGTLRSTGREMLT